MRIAHFVLGRANPDNANGADKTVYFLARAQARLGNSVGVFSLSSKEVIPIQGARVANHAPKQLPVGLSASPLSSLAALTHRGVPPALLADLRSWDPDVVHLHSVHVLQNILIANSLRKRGIPYVVTPNGGLSERAMQFHGVRKRAAYYLIERKFLERAAFIHCVSRLDLDGLRSLRVDRPTVLAPNGIDLEDVPDAREGNGSSPQLAPLDGRTIFLYVGRLDPVHKGLDVLIRAFSLAREAHPQIALVFVGPDWEGGEGRLQSLVAEMNLGDDVRFLGAIFGNEKWDLLRSASVFVHPSRWDGLAFSMLEALAAGKPVVSTVGADPERMVETAGAGLVSDLETMPLARAIASLAAASPDDLTEMGNRARKLIEQRFAWEKIATALTDAYPRRVG